MGNNTHIITNSKERKRVFYSFIILALAIAAILFLIFSGSAQSSLGNFRTLRKFRGLTGQLAAYGFTFSIAMYVIRKVIKHITKKDLKKRLLSLARIVREWHVPVSIIAFSIVILHVYIVLSRGFFFDLRYVSGLTALVILAIQMLSGIFRYKRKAVRLHLYLGILFILLMIVHIVS